MSIVEWSGSTSIIIIVIIIIIIGIYLWHTRTHISFYLEKGGIISIIKIVELQRMILWDSGEEKKEDQKK